MDELTVIGCDLYNQVITGKVACALTASMEVAGHSGPKIIVLNFQGSKSNNVCADDGTCYSLNAMHGHDMHVLCHKTEVLVLNDQGGSIMSVSDKPSTLRAQMKHHEPIVCFEPGIAKRDGNGNRFIEDKCGTLRANMGDNQPAVCYAIDQQGGKGGANFDKDKMPTLCSDSHGTPHAVCYEREETDHE